MEHPPKTATAAPGDEEPKKPRKPRVEVRGTPLESKIVEMSIRGDPVADIVSEIGADRRTIMRARESNREKIDAGIEELRLEVIQKIRANRGQMFDALLESGSNPEARHQPQAAKVAYEAAGLIGNKGVNVHIGDRFEGPVQVNLDAKVVHEYDPDLHSKLRESMGLG